MPPPGREPEALRDEIATLVLGVGHLRDRAASQEHWRSLLDQAKQHLNDLDLLGIRVSELWLRPPAITEARVVPQDLLAGLNLKEDYITVQCKCEQRSSSANIFMLESFEVRVMSFWGTTVGAFRGSLVPYLPADAQVLEELEGGQMLALDDEDTIPERVTVSEFRGRMRFYIKFSRDQALFFLTQVDEFLKKPGWDVRRSKLMEESTSFRAYNTHVSKILMTEVYPPIVENLGLPTEGTISSEFFGQALEKVAHMDRLVNDLQLKVTIGLRTWNAAKQAVETENWLRHLEGAPPLVVQEYPFLHWSPEHFQEWTERKCNLATLLKRRSSRSALASQAAST